jgi:hypothetical protein
VSVELDLELAGELHGGAPVPAARTALWWRAGSTDTRAVDLVHARFGFVPTTWLHFRLGPGAAGPQLDELVAVVVAALGASTGDAVLHADFESVWLVRRWTPTRLAALPAAVTRAPLDP